MLFLQKYKSYLTWGGVALYFAVVTAGITFPLILNMNHAIAGEIGDNIYFVWMIAWMKKAIFELHTNPFNVWFLNYPEGWNMAYTEITPIMLILALPFTIIGSATLAYNAAMMLTFILSGLFMFVWIKHLTGRVDAALVAGTIYAFTPYHFAHFLIGHLNLSGIQWFPLYFMGLTDLLLKPRQSNGKINWKAALLAGLSLGLIGWTSQYYLYMALFISLVFIVGYPILTGWKTIFTKSFWINLVIMGAAALPLVGIAIAPYVMLSRQGGLPDRNMGVTEMYSASPTDFFLPSTLHFIWGNWVGQTFNREMWIEGTLYVGVIALILAAIAILTSKKSPYRSLIIITSFATLAAVILAMGIDLHWNGEVVKVAVPALLKGWIKSDTTVIPLPGYYLFKYFPFFAKLRALMRFGVFNLVLISMLAGLGCAWLLRKITPKWQKTATVVLILLVLVDFLPRPFSTFSEISPRPVDAWLALQPGKGALVQMPFIESEDQQQTFYTLYHGKPFIGGFFNAFPPSQYQKITPVLDRFPDTGSITLLKKLGVEFVLLDKNAYPDGAAIKAKCAALGLQFDQEVGDQWVFTWRK
jgi:hypothetical protein